MWKKKNPSGMTHGKSSRTERDGGEAKLLPLTRPRRAFGPVPGAAAGLLQGPPGQVGPSGAAAEPKLPMSKHVGETGRV